MIKTRLRTSWWKLLLLTICCSMASVAAFSADYYVQTTGSNATGNGTAAKPWQTISYAVSKAAAGDVIRIGSGTFTEQVVITKNLTLVGQGIGQTIINSPNSLATNFTFTIGPPPAPAPYKAVVYVENADNAIIRNLTINGKQLANDNIIFNGIAYRNAGGLVDGCLVTDVRGNPPYQHQFGYGIFAVADGGAARSLTVSNSRFTLFQKMAIAFLGKDLTGTADGNTIEGAGMLSSISQNGIQLSFNAAGTIKNNTISSFTSLGNTTAIGIFVTGARTGVNITGNTLINCETGIYCINSTGSTITANRYTFEQSYLASQSEKPDPADEYYRWGILVRNGSYLVNQNEIDGDGQGTGIDGFALANESTFLTALNNIVKNMITGISVEVDDSPGCVGGEIHYNSITNTLEPLYYLPDPSYTGACPPPCATCNWFGSPNEADFADLLVGGNLMTYRPWLTSGVDTEPATPGFQPAPVNGCSCKGFDFTIKKVQNILCYGESDGAVTIKINGGKDPYTYVLNGKDEEDVTAAEFTIEDLEAGDYTLTVKDADGFTHTLTFNISQPATPVEAAAIAQSNSTCNGSANGSVTISASGGVAPYSIVGRKGTFTSTIKITGLAAGEYSFEVADANGCKDDVSIEIEEPAPLVVEASEPVNACNGSNGAVTITASGGTPPYKGDGEKTGLAPGTYQFVVTDAAGCKASVSVTIGGTGAGAFAVQPETFPNTFNTGFGYSLYNRSFTGSQGTWTVNSNSNATMVVTRPYYSPSSSYALKVVNNKTWFCGSGWTSAVSPKLNLSNACCPAGVTLDFTLWTYSVDKYDQKANLEIDFSSNNGATWTQVWSRSSAQLYAEFGAAGKGQVSIGVPQSFQNSNFRYRIRGEMAAGDYNNFYVFIDDIRVASPSGCAPLGAIGDYVWNDLNGNGKQDASEPGIPNVTVTLTLPGGSTRTTTTGSRGEYSFTGLPAGTYVVSFNTPAGFVPTTSNAGSNDAIDSDPVNGKVTVVLGAGQVNNTIDAGFKVQACTNTTQHVETFPYKFNSYFSTSLYNKTFSGSSGTWTVNSNNRAAMSVVAPCYSPSGSYALKVINLSTGRCESGWAKAVSPTVNLSNPCCPSGLKMTFTLWTYKVSRTDNKAKLEIDFSSNNGATWTEVWSKTSSQLYYSYGAGGKVTVSIAVPQAFQNSNFRYRIRGEMAPADCNNFYVFMDDIKITSPASCTPDYGKCAAPEQTTGKLSAIAEVQQPVLEDVVERPAFTIRVFPNPTSNEFSLQTTTGEKEPVLLRVSDLSGRVVKTLHFPANSAIRFGAEFRPGVYMLEVLQGKNRQTLKLIKQ